MVFLITHSVLSSTFILTLGILSRRHHSNSLVKGRLRISHDPCRIFKRYELHISWEKRNTLLH